MYFLNNIFFKKILHLLINLFDLVWKTTARLPDAFVLCSFYDKILLLNFRRKLCLPLSTHLLHLSLLSLSPLPPLPTCSSILLHVPPPPHLYHVHLPPLSWHPAACWVWGCPLSVKAGVFLWREVITNIQIAQDFVTLVSIGVAGVTKAQLSGDVSWSFLVGHATSFWVISGCSFFL